MISSFKIDGFRSLKNFSLSLDSGLNVLVGPNGSGKTNIVDAMAFVGDVMSGPLGPAIQSQGGTGGIFSRDASGNMVRRIRCTITGWERFSVKSSIEGEPKKFPIAFEYKFTLLLDKGERPRLTKQCLELHNFTEDIQGMVAPFSVTIQPSPPHLKIVQRGSAYFVEHADFVHLGPNSIGNSTDSAGELQSRMNSKDWGEQSLPARLEQHFLALHVIRRGASGLRAMSVRPSQIRLGDDLGSDPIVRPDGGGLASFVHAVETGSHPDKTVDECALLYAKLNNSLALAVPSLASVHSVADPVTARLRLLFQLKNHDGPAIHNVSDGTLKWLAVSASLTGQDVFAIEEPENFLHPWMQQELIRMLRSECEGRNKSFVISTHSETILNCLDPKEIVVVSHNGEKTSVRRIKNAKALRDSIGRTGFGLGYHYLTGEVGGIE